MPLALDIKSVRSGQYALAAGVLTDLPVQRVDVPINARHRRVYVAWVCASDTPENDISGSLQFGIGTKVVAEMKWRAYPKMTGACIGNTCNKNGGPMPPFFVSEIPYQDVTAGTFNQGFVGYPLIKPAADEMIWLSVLSLHPETGLYRGFEIHALPLNIPIECDVVALKLKIGAPATGASGNSSAAEVFLAVHSSEIPF